MWLPAGRQVPHKLTQTSIHPLLHTMATIPSSATYRLGDPNTEPIKPDEERLTQVHLFVRFIGEPNGRGYYSARNHRTMSEAIVEVDERLMYVRNRCLRLRINGYEYWLYGTDVSEGFEMFIRQANEPDEKPEDFQAAY